VNTKLGSIYRQRGAQRNAFAVRIRNGDLLEDPEKEGLINKDRGQRASTENERAPQPGRGALAKGLLVN